MKDEILDVVQDNKGLDAKLVSERNKLIYLVAATMLLNVVLDGILYYNEVSILSLFKFVVTNSFFTAATGFFIGIFFGMIPYKKLSFDKKYLRASLYVLLALNVFLIISRVTLQSLSGYVF